MGDLRQFSLSAYTNIPMERYSEEDLAQFAEKIKEEYALAKKELESLRAQVQELSSTMAEGFGADMGEDRMGDSDIVCKVRIVNNFIILSKKCCNPSCA